MNELSAQLPVFAPGHLRVEWDELSTYPYGVRTMAEYARLCDKPPDHAIVLGATRDYEPLLYERGGRDMLFWGAPGVRALTSIVSAELRRLEHLSSDMVIVTPRADKWQTLLQASGAPVSRVYIADVRQNEGYEAGLALMRSLHKGHIPGVNTNTTVVLDKLDTLYESSEYYEASLAWVEHNDPNFSVLASLESGYPQRSDLFESFVPVIDDPKTDIFCVPFAPFVGMKEDYHLIRVFSK
jgi:hypothetical protein